MAAGTYLIFIVVLILVAGTVYTILEKRGSAKNPSRPFRGKRKTGAKKHKDLSTGELANKYSSVLYGVVFLFVAGPLLYVYLTLNTSEEVSPPASAALSNFNFVKPESEPPAVVAPPQPKTNEQLIVEKILANPRPQPNISNNSYRINNNCHPEPGNAPKGLIGLTPSIVIMAKGCNWEALPGLFEQLHANNLKAHVGLPTHDIVNANRTILYPWRELQKAEKIQSIFYHYSNLSLNIEGSDNVNDIVIIF